MIRCDSEINEKVNKYLNVLMIECGLNISLDKLIKSGDHCYLETISMINNAISMAHVSDFGLNIKQKTKEKDLKRKFRYCISPLDGLEVWFSYEPSSTEGRYLSKKEIEENILSISHFIKNNFSHSPKLVASLASVLNNNPLFLKEKNYKRELLKLKSTLSSIVWSDENRLDFINLFKSFNTNKEVVIFAGGTSSGKTYQALNLLKEADSGLYLGPLRLNALEAKDALNDDGIPCDLITGEEKILDLDSRHQASTVEMMNMDEFFDVVVLDEAQLMDDKERGWAFTNAILGSNTSKLAITCPIHAIEKITTLLSFIDITPEVVKLERKTKLLLSDNPKDIELDVTKHTAIVAFSRKRIFQIKSTLEKKFKVSLIYGGMPPDVRREQARLFREGETDVVVATDAIGLGLNLPIKNIIFDNVIKYDGEEERALTQAEILQIAGRAGRYLIFNEGEVSGVCWKQHLYIGDAIQSRDETKLSQKYFSKVPLVAIKDYMSEVGVLKLSVALSKVYELVDYDKEVFLLSDVSEVLSNIQFIEMTGFVESIDDTWRIAHIPVDIANCERTFVTCLSRFNGGDKDIYIEERILSLKVGTIDSLFELEKLSNQIDCISWFYNKYESLFSDFSICYIQSLRTQVFKKMNEAVKRLKK